MGTLYVFTYLDSRKIVHKFCIKFKKCLLIPEPWNEGNGQYDPAFSMSGGTPSWPSVYAARKSYFFYPREFPRPFYIAGYDPTTQNAVNEGAKFYGYRVVGTSLPDDIKARVRTDFSLNFKFTFNYS